MNEVWQFILDKQSAAVPVMLLYVLESKGSSPGRQGFKMAVAADGNFCGTIGGGIMEHKFVEMAKSKLIETSRHSSLHKQVHDKSVTHHQSGMICSGEQTVFLYELQLQDMEAVSRLLKSLVKNLNGCLRISESGLSFHEVPPAKDFHFKTDAVSGKFLFEEKTGFKNILHIVGGGHCALALSRLMKTLDFYIKVYDERVGLSTMTGNKWAHEKIVLESYDNLQQMITEGENVYVVIMTFGYRTDDRALRAIFGKSFKYIGMLGSKKKAEKLFSEYEREPVDPDFLKKIHSPIGIQVKSQTTAEIAVSIAAEIISVKNKDLV
jgi:xanthine dehydrogenase accessory factor